MKPLHPHRERLVLLAAMFAFAALVIWVRTETVKATYRYVGLEKELRKSQQELQALRVEWLRLTAPKRLDSLAQALGLGPPKIRQILKYDASSASATPVASR